MSVRREVHNSPSHGTRENMAAPAPRTCHSPSYLVPLVYRAPPKPCLSWRHHCPQHDARSRSGTSHHMASPVNHTTQHKSCVMHRVPALEIPLRALVAVLPRLRRTQCSMHDCHSSPCDRCRCGHRAPSSPGTQIRRTNAACRTHGAPPGRSHPLCSTHGNNGTHTRYRKATEDRRAFTSCSSGSFKIKQQRSTKTCVP